MAFIVEMARCHRKAVSATGAVGCNDIGDDAVGVYNKYPAVTMAEVKETGHTLDDISTAKCFPIKSLPQPARWSHVSGDRPQSERTT